MVYRRKSKSTLVFNELLYPFPNYLRLTMVENKIKSLIQHCERSELCLHLYKKMPKIVNLASFLKPEVCGQTVLPDMSVLRGQKLMKNAKIQKFKSDILSNFNRTKIDEKCQNSKNSNATFRIIFKQYEILKVRKKKFKNLRIFNFRYVWLTHQSRDSHRIRIWIDEMVSWWV